MAEARQQRDNVADGVAQGYVEAMMRAKLWTGSKRRWWHDVAEPGQSRGLTGAALERAVMTLAISHPEYVQMVRT